MSNKTILVAEDSDVDFEYMERSFKKHNIANQIFRCKNGEEALDYIYNRKQFEDQSKFLSPAILLLDLNMPKKDGFEVLEVLKNDQEKKHIPIIILSTSEDKMDINRCYELGANSYVVKPVGVPEYISAFEKIKGYWLELSVMPQK